MTNRILHGSLHRVCKSEKLTDGKIKRLTDAEDQVTFPFTSQVRLMSILHVFVVINRNFNSYVPLPYALLPDFVAEPFENVQLPSYMFCVYDVLVHVDETPGT